MDRKANLKSQKEDEEKKEREKTFSEEEIEERLEKLLGVINTDLMAQEAQALHDALASINYLPISYLKQVNGGEYRDARRLQDAKLPNNNRGARVGLAQQVLHEKMVQSQYQK
jgi:hypothetical protein